ncbi:MAG: hypothetical protein U5N58_09560 [Actinomycetota bacterium]|nr:hypothetical protein [Actinomycetota bacterium]
MGTPKSSNPNLLITAIAKNKIDVKKGTLKGTAIAGGDLVINKDWAESLLSENLKEYLPPDIRLHVNLTKSHLLLSRSIGRKLKTGSFLA